MNAFDQTFLLFTSDYVTTFLTPLAVVTTSNMERKTPAVIKNKVVSTSIDLLPKVQIAKQSVDKTKYYLILKSLPVLSDFLIASSDTHITVAEIQNGLAKMKIGKNWKLLSTEEEIAKVINSILFEQYIIL